MSKEWTKQDLRATHPEPRYSMAERIRLALLADPYLALFSERTIEQFGWAVALHCCGKFDEPSWTKGTSPGWLYTEVLAMLESTPLYELLSTKARIRMAEVVRDSVFPEQAKQREEVAS